MIGTVKKRKNKTLVYIQKNVPVPDDNKNKKNTFVLYSMIHVDNIPK